MERNRRHSSASRRLAAVMFTDIVGYSKLMAIDEEKTVNHLVENKNSQKQIIKEFEGTVWKDLGDGIMASFSTIRDAILCAERVADHSRIENRFNLRIGIHLCDITVREGDIYGEGVNIASRVAEKAGPNEIFISEAAYLTLCNHNFHKVEFKGRKRLKNIPEAIGIYELIIPQTGQNDEGLNNNGKQVMDFAKKTALVGFIIPLIVHLLTSIPFTGPLF